MHKSHCNITYFASAVILNIKSRRLSHNAKAITTHSWILSYRLDYVGVAFGLLFYCFSMTPSLLPRPSLMQGLIAGISFAAGYGLGVLISRWLRAFRIPEPSDIFKHYAWFALWIILAIIIPLFGYLNVHWQNKVRQMVVAANLGTFDLLFVWVWTILFASLVILLGRGMRRLYNYLYRRISRRVPWRVARGVGAFIGATIVFLIATNLFGRIFTSLANSIYASTNNRLDASITQPASPLRSGSPDSLAKWKELGRQGRKFVAGGPSVSQLQDFSGKPAMEPIRVYVGLESADSARERAKLAVQELKRTGAFKRKVLVVTTPTGTGWIEPGSIDSLEYMWGGDTATVSMQYSYLPSWISFLVDKERATNSGKALYEAVYDEWSQLDPATRPKLYAYGLSLGSFGGQAAFSGASDIVERSDGALFAGTPNDTGLWRYFTDNRDKGSPEIKPVYDHGTTVRFEGNIEGIQQDAASADWKTPRALYLQHASDPIVWWNYNLLIHEPDWLKEPRGADVSQVIRWYPLVTFLQVTIDQMYSTGVPVGVGHNYANTYAAGWAAITRPSGWTAGDTERLNKIIVPTGYITHSSLTTN